MQASEEQGATPRQQQGPGGTAGRGKARGEHMWKEQGQGGRTQLGHGRTQLGHALPKLFLVISTTARYSRQNINTEAVQTSPDFIFLSESGHKAQSFYFKS